MIPARSKATNMPGVLDGVLANTKGEKLEWLVRPPPGMFIYFTVCLVVSHLCVIPVAVLALGPHWGQLTEVKSCSCQGRGTKLSTWLCYQVLLYQVFTSSWEQYQRSGNVRKEKGHIVNSLCCCPAVLNILRTGEIKFKRREKIHWTPIFIKLSRLESSCLMANLRSTAGNQDGAAMLLPPGTPTFLPSPCPLSQPLCVCVCGTPKCQRCPWGAQPQPGHSKVRKSITLMGTLTVLAWNASFIKLHKQRDHVGGLEIISC